MTQEFVISLGRESLWIVLLLSGPLVGLALAVGILVSLFQATTQIHEQTLTFAPKIVAVFAGLLIFGPWMMTTTVEYAARILNSIPASVR